jgi:glycosyltransferase involved in cell wall biosynthesis
VKVCFVIPSLTSGGAERVAVTVLSALADDYERVLYIFSGADGVYFDRIAPGVQVVIAREHSWLRRLVELARFLRAARPDVVMPFLSYFITALAVWLSRVPARVVFNQGTPTTGFLEDPDFSWRQPLRRALFAAATRWAYRRAAAIVVTSRGVADDLVDHYGVPRSQIRILHNPVDLDAIASAAREPLDATASGGPVLVAAGRLASVKDYPLLIEAMSRLAAPRAWILGEGPERDRLQQMVVERGLGDRVRFWGFQANPWRFIARADVFVLTSRYEGFGNVVIEAMACGTPVVATRSPGTAEIVTDGVNGLLVDHDAGAVAGAISRLLNDRSLRDRVVARASEDVRHYALPRVAERYDRLFQELVA